MAQFQRPNPWDPRYATPNYIYGEPPGRGTLVTDGIPRGTIDTANAHETQANYAVPGYVLAETQGRGAYDTKGLPRRFVDTKSADDLARPLPNARGSLSGTVFSKKTLRGSSLGDVAAYGRARQNPFRLYGIEAAKQIDRDILSNARLSSEKKESTLREVLNKIDSRLLDRVSAKTEQYRLRGLSAKEALICALADELGKGLASEVSQLGSRRNGGVLSGLGATVTSSPIVIDVLGARFTVTKLSDGSLSGSNTYTILASVPEKDRLNALRLKMPKGIGDAFVKKWASPGGIIEVGRAFLMRGCCSYYLLDIGGGNVLYTEFYDQAGALTPDPKKPVKVILRIKKKPPSSSILGTVISAPFKLVSGIISPVLSAASGVTGEVLGKLGDLACKAVNSPLATVAAGTAGASQGGETGAQVGVAGAQVAQSMCGGGTGAAYPVVAEQPKSILPWVIGGAGALLLIVTVAK